MVCQIPRLSHVFTNSTSLHKTEGYQDCHCRCGRRVSDRSRVLLCPPRFVPGTHDCKVFRSPTHLLYTNLSVQHIKTMDHPLRASEPFLLIGLLANYDKFETQNQYRVRLADYLNESAMQKVVESVGWTCRLLQERYIAILDDTPAVWSIGGTLSYVGLGALARTKPAAPVLSEDEQRTLFGEQ
jgi:hypothetical protein